MSMNIELREYCPDCGVRMGLVHSGACDVDHCLNCGAQLLAGCCEHPIGPNVWTGIWPGTLECTMYGLYATFDETGWHKATADTPNANEDLNTLYSGEYFWDKEQHMWRHKYE